MIEVGASDTHSSGELREAVNIMAAGPLVTIIRFSWKRILEVIFSFWIFSRRLRKMDTRLSDLFIVQLDAISAQTIIKSEKIHHIYKWKDHLF